MIPGDPSSAIASASAAATPTGAAGGAAAPSGRLAASAEAAPWHRVRLWDIQIVRDLASAIGIVAGVWLAWELRALAVPMLIALLAADLWEPVVRSATRWRPWLTRTRFVLASALLALLATALVFAVTLPPLVVQSRQLVRDAPVWVERAVSLGERPWVPALVREHVAAARAALSPSTGARAADDSHGADSIGTLARSGLTVVNAVMGSLGHLVDLVLFLFLTPFLAVVFSLNFPRLRAWLRALAPAGQRERVARIVKRMEHSVGGFFRGRALVCLCLATVYAVGLTICGVPYGLLLGLVTGLLCLIPWLHFAGLPIAWLLLAAHVGDGSGDSLYVTMTAEGARVLWWRVLLLPVAVFSFAQLLDDYVLSPLIQGQKTDLHPATVMLSIIAGGVLAGFWGLVIAVPAVACLKIAAHEFLPPLRRWREASGVQDRLIV